MKVPLRWIEEALDDVFPRACRLCGEASQDDLACPRHAWPDQLRGPRCGRCSAALPDFLPMGATCATCRRQPPPYHRVIARADYGGAVREWLLSFKHGGRRDLAGTLAALLQEACRGDGPVPDAMVPIPLHALRRIERGYDQAALLAEELARHVGVPVRPWLSRRRSTVPQGSPGSVSRRANLRGAFVCSDRGAMRRIVGKHVVLVDDVLTSGATLEEAARVLRRAGARRVDAWVLARAGGNPLAVPSALDHTPWS